MFQNIKCVEKIVGQKVPRKCFAHFEMLVNISECSDFLSHFRFDSKTVHIVMKKYLAKISDQMFTKHFRMFQA